MLRALYSAETAEAHIAREQQQRREPDRQRQAAGGQDGRHQRRADVGAEQHRQSDRRIERAHRGQTGDDERHRSAALQEDRGSGPGKRRHPSVRQVPLDETLEPVAPAPHDAGAHHAHAPQQ